MGKINLLDDLTANQIAAGEVIERPVSAVKELVENALDAGARKIIVEIAGGGLEKISVTDDGSGMSEEDLLLAVKRHATSKLKKITDLETLRTLGFRGEALPSIVSVAKVEIITREEAAEHGFKLSLEGNEQKSLEPCGAPQGTSVIVRDLFFNTPARRKFLRSAGYEAGLIHELMIQMALGYPEVDFSLYKDDKEILNTRGINKLEDLIMHFYGREAKQALVQVSGQTSHASVDGFLTLPTYHRSNRNAIHFFVNNRKVLSKEIMKAVENAYEYSLPKARFPLVILNITFDPALLDVNVHPGKLEIRIRDQFFVLQLSELLKEKITEAKRVPSYSIIEDLLLAKADTDTARNFSMPKPGNMPKQEVWKEFYSWQPDADLSGRILEEKAPVISLGRAHNSDLLPVGETEETKVKQDLTYQDEHNKIVGQEEVFNSAQPEQGQVPIPVQEVSAPVPEASPRLPALQVIGQLAQTFILAEGEEGLFIIDQHVAHERVLFERLSAQAGEKGISSQVLLIPKTLELTLLEEELLIKHILPLTDLGLVIEHFGPRTYLIRAVPAVVKEDPADFLLALLQELEEKGDRISTAEIRKEVIVTASCKGAIKAGDKISLEAAQKLLEDLALCANPMTCPHGRPIVYKLTHQELLKVFQRI